MKTKHLFALILLGCTGLTQFYVYDSLTSIDSFLKSELNFTSSSFGLLYSFYSLANVLFFGLIFSGILVDKWGYQKSGVLLLILCVLGTSLTQLGVSYGQGNFKIMLLGRMILGVGLEGLTIVILRALVNLFESRQALSLGVVVAFFRTGTFLALNLQVLVARAKGLQSALLLATWISALGFVFYLIYLAWEKRNPLKKTKEEIETFKLRDIQDFPISYWYLTLICIFFYGGVATFNIFSPDLLKYRFHYSTTLSAQLSSLMLIGNILTIPIFGAFIDKFGKKASLMVLSTFISLIGIIAVLLTKAPLVPIFLIGIAFSMLVSSFWASVPTLVPRKCLGTAFAILTYVQNIALMVFPWLGGVLVDRFTSLNKVEEGAQIRSIDFTPFLLFLISLVLMSLIFSIVWRSKIRSKSSEITLH